MPIERGIETAMVKWDVKSLLLEIEDLAFINRATANNIELNVVGITPQEEPSKQEDWDNVISRLRRIRDSLISSNVTLSNVNKTLS